MSKLNKEERSRLIALLGMLGSEHDGEVVNAARLATKFIKDRKMTWTEVFTMPSIFEDIGARNTGFKADAKPEHVEMAEAILAMGGRHFSAKELAFAQDMLEWRYPTEKQLDWLTKLYKRTM